MGTRIVEWDGRTNSHGFMAEVYEDREQGLYTAVVTAHTPAMAPVRLPGQEVATMSFEPEAKIRSDDLETLKALARKLISDRWGEILHFREGGPKFRPDQS